MDDEQILARGGDENDIKEYAKQNGADLTEEDTFITEVKMVPPHRKISRPVTLADRHRVEAEGEAMIKWMNSKYSCVGLAHPQIESEDPLAFFVALHEPAGIILNPVIVRASETTVPSKEGCMTYPDREHLVRDRYKAIEVEYQVFKGKKMERKKKLVTGFLAIVYQHEIDHLNGVYCYDTRIEEKNI